MSSLTSTKNLARVLGKKELFGIAVGQIIGAGIMALTGIAIGYTGKSIVLAYIVTTILSLFAIAPSIFSSSMVRLRGGQYTEAALFVNKRFAGMSIIIHIAFTMTIALYAISFSDYMLSLIPGLNKSLVSVVVLTVFYLANLLGVKQAARFQNFLVFVLAIGISVFIGYGIPEVQPGYFSGPDFMPNGIGGLLMAGVLLNFAMGGASFILNFGAEAKNPTKDIPFVIITSTLFVAVIYALMGYVAAGVLPVEQVANQTLAMVASEVLPRPLYVFFIVGGAMFGLATTLNASLAWTTKPLIQACEDGWLPKRLGVVNKKFNSPHWLLTIIYVVGLFPIVVGLDLDSIANIALVLLYFVGIVKVIGQFRIPKLLPEVWEKSSYKVPLPIYYLILFISIISQTLSMIILSVIQPTWVNVGIVVLLVFSLVYSILRDKSGKVNMEVSYELV